MSNIEDLKNIIKDLGGAAPLNDIVAEYQNRKRMVVSSNHRMEIIRTLNGNGKVVVFDNIKKIWCLAGETKNTGQNGIRNIFHGFDFNSKEHLSRMNWVFGMLDDFLKRYPLSSIKNLTLDEYAVSPEGKGNDYSFCRLLRYDLNHLCSMGNAFPATFEIYKNGEGEIMMSKGLERDFGNDYKAAFESVKKRIIDFLDAASRKDTNRMNDIKLNSAFKLKLACVYFLDTYYPGPVKEYLRQSCFRLGAIYDERNLFNTQINLSEWKKQFPETKDINNFTLMAYADYLIKNDLSMTSINIGNNPYKQ